jgi:heat-inducible transcriptional repressor
VLKAVIAMYILHAEPVSSRLVARRAGLGLSAATIRNVMADLEEQGYLAQPHTSAGRVPTGTAYHLFIESMMQGRTIPVKERRYVVESLRSADADELVTVASHLLSELSSQVSIVVTPTRGDTALKAVDFIPLSGRKVLCVVVSTAGFVDNRVISTDQPLSREKLVEAANYLNANCAGLTLREIRDRLVAKMAEERGEMDRLLALTVELAGQGLSFEAGGEVLVDGATAVLQQPELADIARVRRLFETFADRARLVRILNQCMAGEGVRVWIGEDSEVTSALGFSLVATNYGLDERPLGSLGVFGPSRMEYDRVIPLVSFLGESLSRALAGHLGTAPTGLRS